MLRVPAQIGLTVANRLIDYAMNLRLHRIALLALWVAFLQLLPSAQALAQVPTVVTLEAARNALETSSHLVVDIREPDEHATGVAKGMRLIPMSQLGKRLGELATPNQQPVLLICNTQNRSARVVEQLRAAGYSNVSYVHGGMSLWATRGWPMVKPGGSEIAPPRTPASTPSRAPG